MLKILLFFLLFLFILFPTLVNARVTPADIIGEEIEAYNLKLSNYSPEGQKKAERLFNILAEFNEQKSHELELIAERQGKILDEYVIRNNISEDGGADGINRSNDPVAVARIEITRAHEAIAYQAAKNYIPNLTNEANLKQDFLNEVSNMQYEMTIPINKLIYSQSLLLNLINK